jgi:hypothetical protein
VLPDFADLALEHLALDEVDAIDLAGGWRAVALEALVILHQRHLELTRLKETHARLIEEYRVYRAATITKGAAA